MKKNLALKKILFLVPILFLLNNAAFGCSCFGKTSVKKSIKSSDAVLVGKVISREEVIVSDSTLMKIFPNDSLDMYRVLFEYYLMKYEFEVEELYKGRKLNRTIHIYSGRGSSDCGYVFDVGEKYIVYGMKQSYFGNGMNELNYPEGRNILWTDICMRTTEFNQEEIIAIRKCKRKKRIRT